MSDRGKYATGEYIVRFFNRYGTKEGDLPALNFIEGRATGYDRCGDGSFVLLRVVHNSLDPHPTGVRDLEEGEE